MWLLDTNILIKSYKLNPKPFKRNLTITTILSILEFPLAANFENLSVIYPVQENYSQSLIYALLLRKNGTPIPVIDILIGAIAVKRDLILVTEDSHFEALQAVEPRLKVSNLEIFLENFKNFEQ